MSLDASLKVATPKALVRLAAIVAASYDADGSADILSMLDGVPDTYGAWALEYYERDLPLKAIESVYQHRALTEELVVSLIRNKGWSFSTLRSLRLAMPLDAH